MFSPTSGLANSLLQQSGQRYESPGQRAAKIFEHVGDDLPLLDPTDGDMHLLTLTNLSKRRHFTDDRI